MMSLSARRAWIENINEVWANFSGLSLSARRAWIENDSDVNSASGTLVALRKESVDRKAVTTVVGVLATLVALRKESVDRKVLTLNCTIGPPLSLSARRAWIEKTSSGGVVSGSGVALRKESVDRKDNLIRTGSRKAGRSPQGERG